MFPSKSLFCAIPVALLCGFSCLAANEARVITSIAEIRGMSREEAAQAVPVRVRGVVTWQDTASRPTFFIHDGQWNMWVDRSTARRRDLWQGGDPPVEESMVGALVEVEGVTDPGGYAPCIVPVRFHRVGSQALPEARRVPLERLLSGSEDGQRVEVEGVVQAVSAPDDRGDVKVIVMVDGHPCRVASENGWSFNADQFVDARVRVRGALVPLANLRAQVAGLRMVVMGAEDFEIVTPPPHDPFQAHKVPLGRLLPFSAHATPFHRKVTEGVVTFAAPGQFFFMQEGASSVRVQSTSARVMPGDRVEVAGFIDTSHTLAALAGAIVRPLGRTEVPAPAVVAVQRILHPTFRGPLEKVAETDFSGRLVRFPGELLRIERRDTNLPLSLIIASEGCVFPAVIPSGELRMPSEWVAGARLELTGVCELDFLEDASTQSFISISGFRLWLRSAQDIHVISVPSWWTPPRLSLALAGTVSVLCLALAWVLLLRRQVDRQMAIISGKLHREAVNSERNRLARDLHDTLEQQLAGVALHLDGAEDLIRDDPDAASEVVALAGRMLRHTRIEARRSVWDLRSQVLEAHGLGAALEALARSVTTPFGPVVEVSVNGASHPLPLGADFQILRVAQEALANSLKHSGARRIHIDLEMLADSTRLTVHDDGVGFPTSAPVQNPVGAHFGLLGMRERAGRIGASLTIASEPGRGCTITLGLPHFPLPSPNVPPPNPHSHR